MPTLLHQLTHEIENVVFPDFIDEELTQKTKKIINSITCNRHIKRGNTDALREFLIPLYQMMKESEDKFSAEQLNEHKEYIHLAEKEIERLEGIEEDRKSFVIYMSKIIKAIMTSHPKNK